MAKVIFTFEENDNIVTIDNAEEGYSILEIAEENGIHLNHNCGAVCACSTCHIYVLSGDDYLEEISDKEENFIDRAINPTIESRLGCQAVLLDENARLEVKIPDQSKIIGHEH